MNSHEEQLILQLASGSLPQGEARRLEASLSEEAQRELAAHRLVLGAIAATDEPVMTDIERARMHRVVADGVSEVTRELNATQIATPATPIRKRARTIRWMRFASGAAAAAVLVGVVAVGTQLPGGSSDSSDTTTIGASGSATTAAGGSEASLGDDTPLAGTTAEVFPTTTTAARARALSEAPPIAASTEDADFEALARFLTREEVTDLTDLDLTTVAEVACYGVADDAADNQELVKAFTLQYLDKAAVGFQTDAVDDEEAIRIYDLQTCEILATAPR